MVEGLLVQARTCKSHIAIKLARIRVCLLYKRWLFSLHVDSRIQNREKSCELKSLLLYHQKYNPKARIQRLESVNSTCLSWLQPYFWRWIWLTYPIRCWKKSMWLFCGEFSLIQRWWLFIWGWFGSVSGWVARKWFSCSNIQIGFTHLFRACLTLGYHPI